MSSKRVEFYFRVWVHPVDGDSADVETWFHGLIPTGADDGDAQSWVRDSFCNEDFHDLFELDKEKHWQVVGKGFVRGWHDYFGEYDEELGVLEFQKKEVGEGWFDDCPSLGFTPVKFDEIHGTVNRQGMRCHDVSDVYGTHIGVAHNAGFPCHACIFISGNEITLPELEAIVGFLKDGICDECSGVSVCATTDAGGVVHQFCADHLRKHVEFSDEIRRSQNYGSSK